MVAPPYFFQAPATAVPLLVHTLVQPQASPAPRETGWDAARKEQRTSVLRSELFPSSSPRGAEESLRVPEKASGVGGGDPVEKWIPATSEKPSPAWWSTLPGREELQGPPLPGCKATWPPSFAGC